MGKVKFKDVDARMTRAVGTMRWDQGGPMHGKDVVVYLIRIEANGFYSVYVSSDGGQTGRLLPRLSTATESECYHESVEAAKEWIIKEEGA